MAKYEYDGPDRFRPISPWGYIGYTILFSIPVLGLLLLFFFALSNKRINRRNLARAYWCIILVGVIISAAVCGIAYLKFGNIRDAIFETFPKLERAADTLGIVPAKTSSSSLTTSDKDTGTPEPTAAANAADTPTETPEVSEQPTVVPTATYTAAPTATEASTATPEPDDTESSGVPGVRKEVKDAIDDYEEFFKKYVAFMEKYESSSNTVSMITDYISMMEKYESAMEKFEKLDEEYDFNDAETKYYLDAQLRIDALLLTVDY